VKGRERAGEELRHRQPRHAVDAAQQRGEVAEVAPHELRAEDAVRRRPLLEGPGEVAVVALGLPQLVRSRRPVGHLAEGQPLDDVGVPAGIEVLVRAPRQPGVEQRLEVLLRMPGETGLVEQVAQEGAAASRRRADEIRALGDRHRAALATVPGWRTTAHNSWPPALKGTVVADKVSRVYGIRVVHEALA
jgi:hypothetical protein